MDLQGSELRALMGAKNSSLKNCNYILIEVSIKVEYYKGGSKMGRNL